MCNANEIIVLLEDKLKKENDKTIKFIVGKDSDGYEKSGICINNNCIIVIIKSNLESFSDLYISMYPITSKEIERAILNVFTPSIYEVKIKNDKNEVYERKYIDLNEEVIKYEFSNIEETSEFLYDRINERINLFYEEYCKIYNHMFLR